MLTLLNRQSRASTYCLQDWRRAGAYRLLFRGQVRAFAVLFGARWSNHTRTNDLRLAIATTSRAQSTVQSRLHTQIPPVSLRAVLPRDKQEWYE